MARCEFCGKPLPEHSGRGRRRRFCSDACRQRAHRAGRTMPVPPDMAMADRWLRWRLVHGGESASKRPIRFDGAPASSTDPATWTGLPTAEQSTAGDGLGFALGGGFACIDLDHCYDVRGYLADWAKMLLAPVAGRTWIEISPSGQGLHIWGRCQERKGVKVRGLMDAEAYSQGRYMTYTGHAWRDSPAGLADLTYLLTSSASWPSEQFRGCVVARKNQRMPQGLVKGGKGQRLWKDLTSYIEFTDVELRILENACYTEDRIAKERRAIGDHLTVKGSQGQIVAHPLLVNLRQDEAHFAALIKQIDIPDEQEGMDAGDSRSSMMRSVAQSRWGKAYGVG